MAGVSNPFLFLILGEGISFVLQLLGAHEAVLGCLKADEAQLFL